MTKRSLPESVVPTRTDSSRRSFAPGELLAGRYRIEGLVGAGGMGEVYAARDDELSIDVALKRLKLAEDRTALARLKREVLLARSIGHPHVCRVYDLGWHGEGADRVWFVTMELLRGETLRERLNACVRIAAGDALPLAEQLAAALGAAHRGGVVHRDFKSANVMLVADGGIERAVVTDFGLARVWGDDSESRLPALTAGEDGDEPGRRGIRDEQHWNLTGSDVVGTPAYMSPEQVLRKPAAPSADIYALGVVLFEMVTGKLPFEGGTVGDRLRRRIEEDPPSPRAVVPELPDAWEDAILRCLAREPTARFTRAEDVADALAGRGIVAPDSASGRPGRRPALPAENDAFVGREADLDDVERILAGEPCLVTLLGTGGMGKTRLAVRSAWRGLESWPGGAWFCDLTEARDVNGIASAVAGSLGVPLGKGDPIEQLGHAIAGRGRCLVILDNFEQVVADAEATVGRWRARAAEASFLVTSRERLQLRGEAVHLVGPMNPDAGVALFLERARRQRPGLELSGQELESVKDVVRLVDGMPLAIELAAARMRVMTASELVQRMRERFRLLGGGTPGRHATLEATFDDSWQLLRPWEQAAVSDCAVFESGFTLEAAEAVIDLSPWPEAPWTVDVVQSLVDKSLLRMWVPPQSAGAGVAEARLGMYVSVQEYARARLRERLATPAAHGASVEHAAESRHGAWFARLGTDEAIDALDGHGGAQRRERLEREYENLMTACRRAVARGAGDVAANTFRAVCTVVELRGPMSVGLELGRDVLAMDLTPPDRGRVLAATAVLAWRSGRMDEGRDRHEAALELARQLGDRRGEGIALGYLGSLDWIRGRVEEAQEQYEAALELLREVGDRRTEAVVLGNVGSLHLHTGHIDEARTAFETALATHRVLGDERGEARVLGNLGNLEHVLGRLSLAQVHQEAARSIHRRIGDRRGEAAALLNLGSLLHQQDLVEEACVHHEAARAIFQEVGERRGVGVVCCNLGSMQLGRRNFVEARGLLETALAIVREVADRRVEGVVWGNLGRVELAEGRFDAAREALSRGEVVLRGASDKVQLGMLLCSRATLEHGQGDESAARAALGEAESLAAEVAVEPDSELRKEIEAARRRIAPLR